MIVYLSGPPENVEDFMVAAAKLRAAGHLVLNPVEIDVGEVPQAGNLKLAYVTDFAEGVAKLPGWKESKWAMAEHEKAVTFGVPIFDPWHVLTPGWDG